MPSNCNLTSDYSFVCDVGIGGNAEGWLIELENLKRPLIGFAGEAAGLITAILKQPTKIFRRYQFVLQTASFDEEIVGNRANGTLFYQQKGTIVINKQNVAVVIGAEPVYIARFAFTEVAAASINLINPSNLFSCPLALAVSPCHIAISDCFAI